VTGPLVAAVVMTAAAALVGPSSASWSGRLVPVSRADAPPNRSRRLHWSCRTRLALGAAVGGCVALTVGGPAGAVAGAGAAWAVDRLVSRVPDPAAVSRQEAADRDLPLALDLLACTLRAGQPPATAALAVATAVGGPVGAALSAVARGTDLGSPPELAWQPLARLPGGEVAARTLARAAGSGTRLAEELSRTAGDLRMRRQSAADARVRRAGVLVVLPLGLCFLPAFVCLGVVPIVIGIAGSVLR